MNSQLKTGYEVYDKDDNLDVTASHTYMRDFIIKRNPEKYESFLKKMKKMEFLGRLRSTPDYKIRAKLIEQIYDIMRMIDDVVDGDGPHALGTIARGMYIQKIISYIENYYPGRNGIKYKDLVEHDLSKIFNTAYSIGIFSEVQEGILQIMKSFIFDAERIHETRELKESGTGIIAKRTGKAVRENFYLCDIEGCEKATAIIMGLDWEKAVKLLTALGLAMRDVYTLQDIFSDPKLGLCNISIEELERFGISDEDLLCLENNITKDYHEIPASIQLWVRSVIQRIKDRLQDHHVNIKNEKLDIIYDTYFLGCKTTALTQKISDEIFKKIVFPKAYLGEALEVIAKLENIYGWDSTERVQYLSF